MDRKTVYAGQIPLSAQMLQQDRNEMMALAKFSEAVLGTSTIADDRGRTARVSNAAPQGQTTTATARR